MPVFSDLRVELRSTCKHLKCEKPQIWGYPAGSRVPGAQEAIQGRHCVLADRPAPGCVSTTGRVTEPLKTEARLFRIRESESPSEGYVPSIAVFAV